MIKNSFEHGWTWGDFPLWFWKNRVIFTIGWSSRWQVHSSYNQELLELLENLEIQAPRSALVPTSEHAFFEPLKIAYWLIGYYSELYCYTPSRLLGMIITIHCREAYEPTSIWDWIGEFVFKTYMSCCTSMLARSHWQVAKVLGFCRGHYAHCHGWRLP